MFKRFALALVTLSLSCAAVWAQMDPGQMVIVQGGFEAGAIDVADGRDKCSYVEHWYLFENYVYPSGRNGGGFTVKSEEVRHPDLTSWLREMTKQHPRGTHVEVLSVERRDGCE
jgi:hypothetical protein